jgi:hypothetical protein
VNNYERLLKIPCTVHSKTAGGTDAYGNPTYADLPVSTTCWLDQLSRAEKGVDEVDIEKYRLYLRAGVSISDRDVVEAVGHLFEVEGPPWQVVDPRSGSVHHIEATLRRTT